MNDKLLKLYSEKWYNLEREMKALSTGKIEPANPLLLKVDNDGKYQNADIRLMIFGQETNGWGESFTGNIESTQKMYEDFFLSKKCFTYGGQFWNGCKLFIKKLQEQYPNKSIEFLWNNIVKVGKCEAKGSPPNDIYLVERDNFNVVGKEIEILQPNLILFNTGPYYDFFLKERIAAFAPNEIEGFKIRQLAKFKVEGKIPAYRTYHPNYLYRNNIDRYYDEIIQDLNNSPTFRD